MARISNKINNINIFKLSLRVDNELCSLFFHKDLSNLNEFNKYYLSKINIVPYCSKYIFYYEFG